MKRDYIRKDWLFWIMAMGLASVAALLGGCTAAWAFRHLVHPPQEIGIGFGVMTGLMLFLYTLQQLGVRPNFSSWYF